MIKKLAPFSGGLVVIVEKLLKKSLAYTWMVSLRRLLGSHLTLTKNFQWIVYTKRKFRGHQFRPLELVILITRPGSVYMWRQAMYARAIVCCEWGQVCNNQNYSFGHVGNVIWIQMVNVCAGKLPGNIMSHKITNNSLYVSVIKMIIQDFPIVSYEKSLAEMFISIHQATELTSEHMFHYQVSIFERKIKLK